jgi:hypothetical protein
MLKRLNRPWLHFLLLGAVLFFLQRWLDPPPKPTVGPLSESRVDNLKRQWFSTTGRVPEEQQLAGMIRAELDREILFREGLELEIYRHDPVVKQRLIRNMHFLRMGEGKTDEELYREALRMELHLGDEVVKRRLIQVMEQLLLARRALPAPTAAEINAAFIERKQELRRPQRYTIEHVYLTREREGEIQTVLQSIREQGLDPQQARQMSSPFLPGYRFAAQSPAQLARNFGAAFVLNLEAVEPQSGQWLGPIESTYGYHLVWVESLEPARDAELDEVRDQLVRDLKLQRRRDTLRRAVLAVREQYEVLM